MEKLIKDFPENENDIRETINSYLKVTRDLERGMLTVDEFIKFLAK